MDLRLTSKSTRNVCIWIINCIAAVALLWVTDTYGATETPGRDYRLADEVQGGWIIRNSGLQSTSRSTAESTSLQYRAFDGRTYDVEEYQGLHVSVLLPAGGSPFTADHLDEMLDRLDILYELYTDLIGKEPQGNGPLQIAFVPDTCGMGCGLIGAKGIEIQADPLNYDNIIRELDAGRLESILVHEMVHNFDSYSRYLHYLPDHAHAWTDMFQFFAPYRYARGTLNNEAPDDIFNSPVRAVWKSYVSDPGADWESCVQNLGCEADGLKANHVWAMLYYRVESLHGMEALLDSFSFITDYARKNPAPATDVEKEGLRILSLAVGAGANIACYAEELRWALPESTRNELDRRFPSPNPFCADADGDGFSAVTGDCDDTDASRNIMSREIAGNRMDDDCDDLVDEKDLVESDMGSMPDNIVDPVSTSMPFEALGSASDSEDRDSYRFPLTSTRRARVTLCADHGFRGWAAALQPDGQFLDAPNWYAYQPAAGCSSTTFDYSGLSGGGLQIVPDEADGGYRITVSEASPLPADHSAALWAEPDRAGGVSIRLDDSKGGLSSLGADQLEFWISGSGSLLRRPYAEQIEIDLKAAGVSGLTDGQNYQLRVRPLAGSMPLSAFSSGHLFTYSSEPGAGMRPDHRLSGAWFDPDHEGEGFIVEVLDGETAVVYWFTYHEDGRQRWLMGVGRIESNRIVIDELMDTRGGRFGPDFDPSDVVMTTRGRLALSFSDCNRATANYSVDNRSGHQALVRLTNVAGHECGDATASTALDISGSWFDPAHSGEGFIVQQLGGGLAIAVWFTYNDKGEQAWMLNTGTVNGNRISFTELQRPAGATFGRSYEPEQVTRHYWGELELNLDCSGGTARYETTANGWSSGSQALVPLTRLQHSACAP